MASLKRRGDIYYAQYYVAGRQKRVSLNTGSLRLAREKIRQLESAKFRGEPCPLPTQTRLEDVLTRYVQHIRTFKAPKSAQTDVYYLRQMFGPVCKALQITSRRLARV
ncbi:MAG: hypothetical protein ACYTEL_19380 [Planctomycetota bacterium]